MRTGVEDIVRSESMVKTQNQAEMAWSSPSGLSNKNGYVRMFPTPAPVTPAARYAGVD